MLKKLFPIFIILIVWFIFSKPFFLDYKIPYPTSYQLNNLSLWNNYDQYLGPIKNPAMPDVVGQIMPWKHFTINSWKEKSIPLWNPYSFSGTPHLANYQSSAFSITNLFFFILNFNIAWGFSILIQPLLAGIFMYLFARSMKLSQVASLIASISFMFSGFMTTWMDWGTLTLAISFLPLCLFSIEKYFESRNSIYPPILSVSILLSFLSGHFQTSIYLLIFISLFLFFKLIETKNKNQFIYIFLFILLGILCSSIQLLPSIELYKEASRSLIFQKINAIPFSHLITLISPDFYGNPVTRNDLRAHYIEWNIFTGTITFLLSIYALSIKSKKIFFFIFMLILSLLLCLDTPLLDLFVSLKIPVLSTSSLSRIACILSFSISILAAFGFDQVKKDLEIKKIKKIISWLFLLFLIILFLWIYALGKLINPEFASTAQHNLILPTILTISLCIFVIFGFIKKEFMKFSLMAIIILVSFDMLRFAIKWQPFESKDLTYIETPIIKEIKKLDSTYRILTPFGEEGSVYFNFQSTEGYDPLYIKRYGEFAKALNAGAKEPADRLGVFLPKDGKYFPKAIDFLGIKYVIQKKSDIGKPWAFQFNEYPKDKFKLIYKDKNFQIFENKNVFPKAYIVGDYAIKNNDQEILNKIFDKNFDFKKSVVLEKNPNIKIVKNLKGSVEIISYKPNKITLKTKTNENSLLVISDNHYPGWKAKINESDTEIIRANYTFRAVPIKKGENNIVISYEPTTFRIGAFISILSIITLTLIIAGKWINSFKRKKKSKNVKQTP